MSVPGQNPASDPAGTRWESPTCLLRAAFGTRMGALVLFMLFATLLGCGEQFVGWTLGDQDAPTVTATTPTPGATDVQVNVPVSATFSEVMDWTTATQLSFVVTHDGQQVAGDVVGTGQTAIFIPADSLLADAAYSVVLTTALTDVAGNELAEDFTWTFTTNAERDVLAPQISATNPVDDATGVALNSSILVTFSEVMDPTTLSEPGAFAITLDGVAVTGTVANSGTNTTFIPDQLLAENSLYTATVGATVTDLAGNPLGAAYTWSFTTGTGADTTAPEVSSTIPGDGQVEVVVNTQIVATFTEFMDPTTINSATFELTDGVAAVPGVVTYTGVTATFAPTGTLTNNTEYFARITTGATDLAGNAVETDYTWSFTTGLLGDVTPPEVTDTTPAAGAVNVALNVPLTATFSEPVTAATVNSATFTVLNGETPVFGTVTLSGNTATFEPAEDLDDATVYTATISTAVTDLAGNALEADFVWTFTSGTGADITAPQVSLTSPVNGAVGAPFNAPLTATFTEPMQASSLSASTFTVLQGVTPVNGVVTYAGVTATFAPSAPLAPFTTYTARISTGAQDLAGNTLAADFIWSFTTGIVPDSVPPTVTATSPASNAVLVPFNADITATFSEAMLSGTITSVSFTLRDGTIPVPGAVTYSGITATFRPNSPLTANNTYNALVSATVTDLAGNPLGVDFEWTFQTGATPDVAAPRVTFTVPADDATGVALNSNVSAVFSEPMDPATMTTATVTIQQLDTVIPGTVSYAGVTATFQPDSPLAPLTTYSVTVTAAASDLAGNSLVENYVWNFRTGAGPDLTRPIVLTTIPDDGDINVSLDTAVTVTFSEAMAPLTINDTSFTLEDGLVPIDGSITLVGASAVFVPTLPLEPLTEYTGTVTTAATDLAGNALAVEYVWTFTTGLALDEEPPTVVLTTPADEAIEVPLDASINATFSEAMNPLSVDSVSFEVVGPDLLPLTGVVVYDVLTRIATFTPAVDLESGNTYTATITTEVTDLAGNPMLLDYVWTFSTGDLPLGLAPVDLGSLSTFVAVAGAGLSNSNSSGATILNGDVGLSPTGTCTSDGVTCSSANLIVNGTLYIIDPEGVAAQAKTDLIAAYVDAMSRPPGETVADLSGRVLAPGVYTSASSVSVAVGGVVTLDGQGNSNAVWIFQVGSALTINNNVQILTINGARATNVFWAVGSSSTIGTNVTFQGSVLAQASNSVGTDSTVLGRLLCTTGAITLLSNTITLPPI